MGNEDESLARPNAAAPSTVQVLQGILLGGICRGYNYLTVNDLAVKTLAQMGAGAETIPPLSLIALIEITADPTATSFKDVLLVTEDGVNPDRVSVPTRGMVYGDRSFFQIKGETNLANAKFIGLEAGKTHTLRISFYG